MLRTDSSRPSAHRRSVAGLALVELAVVLGIWGLVLGGIWAVAAQVRLNNEVHTTSAQLLVIVQNVRAVFAEQGGVTGGNGSNLNQALDQLHAFPIEMRQDADPTGVISDLWSHATSTNAGGFSVGSVQVYADDCGGNEALLSGQPCFGVTFLNVPQSACSDLLVQSSQEDAGLQQIKVNGSALGKCAGLSWPISASAAAAACDNANGGGSNDIVWSYLVKGTREVLPPSAIPCGLP